MLQALSDFISKVTHGEKLRIGEAEAQWKKVSELTTGMMIAAYDEGLFWDEILEIRRLPPERVYDIEVEDTHNFVANGIFAHNTVGKALAMLNETGDQNILTASASGTTRFNIKQNGDIESQRFIDIADNTYFLDPAATATSLNVAGDIEMTSGKAIRSTGGISIELAGGTLVVGSGTGKIDAGTIDPPYTINGEGYATYMAGMTGVKEETTGSLMPTEYIPGVGYRSIIDFNNQEKASDLWLFGQVTNLKENFDKLVVLLSPAGRAKTWYTIDPGRLRLAIYSSVPTQISYRLTAPRFDWQKWKNTREPGGFVIESQDTGPPLAFDDGGDVLGAETGEVADVISPISTDSPGVAVRLGEKQTFGIYNRAGPGSPVASFDSEGNATFSGTLYADRIVTRFGDLEEQLSVISYQLSATPSAESSQLDATSSALLTLLAQDIEELKRDRAGPSLLPQASESGTLVIPQDVAIYGNTSIAGPILATGPLTVGSEGIGTTGDTLYVQKNRLASLDILSGTLIVNAVGNVVINGDLAVTGNVSIGGILGVNTITPNENSLTLRLPYETQTDSSGAAKLTRFGQFIITGADDKPVVNIDASGSATFAGNLVASGSGTFSKLVIADQATSSATPLLTSTAGTAVLPADNLSITIPNTLVTTDSLVYITPVTSTKNQVLYVREKVESVGFTVAVDTPINVPITFNWWIIN